MARKTVDELLEGRQLRRMKAEDRFIDRLERRYVEAERMIGALIRDGKEVFYVFPVGGRYREGKRFELVDFLLRNGYC